MEGLIAILTDLSQVLGVPVVEFTAPADVTSKDLLLVGDFYNPAQSSTNELQNDVGKTVCIIEDADGNRYMF